MAKRYSGRATITVLYKDATAPHQRGGTWNPARPDYYACAVSIGGKNVWRGQIYPARAGFGPGIGYDSAKAYDIVARTVLSFAENDGVVDFSDLDSADDGYAVSRRAPTRRR